MKLYPKLQFLFLLLAFLAVGSAADSIGDTLGGKIFKKTLYTSDEIRSKNGRYRLVMQSDCNLVFYGPDSNAIWASNTQNAGKLCVLNLYGGDTPAYGSVLQITDYQERTIWTYNDNSTGDCYLKVDNKGALLFPCVKTLSSITITNPSRKVLGSDTVGGPGCRWGLQVLFTGEHITSRNGAYWLVMQTDCNLVLYHQPTKAALWASQTSRADGSFCRLVPIGPINSGEPPIYDCFGNLIFIEDYLNNKVWSIQGNGYCGLTVKNNGHLIFNCKAYVHGIGDPRNSQGSAIAEI